MKIVATIANNNNILQINNKAAPYVYKLCPIASICKKLAILISAIEGLNVVNTLTKDELFTVKNKLLIILVKLKLPFYLILCELTSF